MSIANLYLIDDDGNRYDFPYDFFLKRDSHALTSNVKNIGFAHGGRNTGDKYLQPRTIMIEGQIRGDTPALFESAKRSFEKAVIAGGKLYVSDDFVTRYIQVDGATIDSSYIGQYRQSKPANVSFVAEFPLWQRDTESTETAVLTDGDSITVDNSDSDVLAYPVITLTADQGADVPSVFLRNIGDGGMALEYNDPNFLQGDVLEIDSYNGTVKRNGNSSIEYFRTPNFLRLQNHAENEFYYEGADITILITWRVVYL
jgi:hypothetical protein